jgi:polysaccharide deacetylase 2 family uncharacterized protein YibQ
MTRFEGPPDSPDAIEATNNWVAQAATQRREVIVHVPIAPA